MCYGMEQTRQVSERTDGTCPGREWTGSVIMMTSSKSPGVEAGTVLPACGDAATAAEDGRRPRVSAGLPLEPLGELGATARHEAAYDALREALMEGRLGPGTILTIRTLARALGTSTMPAREALRRVAAQGGLEAQANGSYRLPMMSLEHYTQTQEIRLRLEGMATRGAVDRLTPEQIRELDGLACAMDESMRRSRRAFLEQNRRFHFLIYEATGMSVLLEIIEMMWLRIGPLLYACADAYDVARANRLHHAIVRALAAGDGEAAAAALRDDIQTPSRVLLPMLARDSATRATA